jgi:xanthine dehydrogenase YagR molybdenum-binding subunit
VLSLLQDNTVLYNNQPIAVVVAETLDQALYAASLIDVKYQEDAPKLDFQAGMSSAHPGSHGKDPADVSEGQFSQALAAAEVTLDEIYTTPIQNHNPMEPHATIAQWDGDKLTLHDATQYISGVKQTVAKALGIPEENVHAICPRAPSDVRPCRRAPAHPSAHCAGGQTRRHAHRHSASSA